MFLTFLHCQLPEFCTLELFEWKHTFRAILQKQNQLYLILTHIHHVINSTPFHKAK